jgi:hypothetical protein
MTTRRASPGPVVRIDLPDGRAAFGRVLRDASIAIYHGIHSRSESPPIGSGEYVFVVGIYDRDLASMPVVGTDPDPGGEYWPPPTAIRPPLPGDAWQIYERGVMRPSTIEEASKLEQAAAWSREHIVERLLGGRQFP